MKKLLSTTALVLAIGLPSMALAQTTAPADDAGAQQQNGQTQGFLSARGQSDLYASDLMGHDVHARRSPQEMNRTENEGRADMSRDGSHEMATMNRAELDDMESIGQINEIVLSSDGQIRALVIGVGGFLGMGEQEVAVTMDQVTFASDDEDRSQMYIVVNTGTEALQESPAYDRTSMATDRTRGDERTQGSAERGAGDRTGFAAPEMQREGYNRVEVTEVTTDMLTGQSVYDVNDNDVGTVTNMIVNDDGGITSVIIDFGGFLGLGVTQVALNFDELTILATDNRNSVRLYVDATKEQIQNLPEYQAAN